MLKGILENLCVGQDLVLETRINQYNDKIADKSLFFENGEWMVGEINCYSSSDLGLGTCQCNSHPSKNYYPIQRQEALLYIRKYIADIEADRKRRQLEIQWLDNAIAELTDITA